MGVTDWEPRALPSEARCRVWAKVGGFWLHSTLGFTRASDRGAIPVDTCAHEFWRPWKDRQPALWSDFFAATHPPIPEGWKKVGEWRYEPDASCYSHTGVARDFRGEYKTIHSDGWWLLVRRVLPAVPHGWEAVGEWHDTLSPCSEVYDWTLLADGRIVQRGETFRGKDERIMGVHIRRVLPDVDWGDVPRDIKILPLTARALGVWRGDTQIGMAVQQDDGKWELQKMNLAGKYANQPSLPAAIVALTGRRDE